MEKEVGNGNEKDGNSKKEKLLAILSSAKDYMSPMALARQVVGKDARTKDINRDLYALQQEGKIKKRSEENGAKPLWRAKKEFRNKISKETDSLTTMPVSEATDQIANEFDVVQTTNEQGDEQNLVEFDGQKQKNRKRKRDGTKKVKKAKKAKKTKQKKED